MLFIKIPCHLWPRPKFFPKSEPISIPSLRSHYYKQWVHACFNWFEWNYSMITSLLLLMPDSKKKSLYFWVPSLSFTNVNSWWVVYLVKNEWLDTFPKQECQNLSLQISLRYKSLIILAPKVLVWLSLETAETSSAGMLWGFFSPLRGMCSRFPQSHNLVQTCTAVTGTWEKKGWRKSVTVTASGCVLNSKAVLSRMCSSSCMMTLRFHCIQSRVDLRV